MKKIIIMLFFVFSVNSLFAENVLKFETVEETQRAFVTAKKELLELGFVVDKTNVGDKYTMLYRKINDLTYCVWVTSYRKRISIEVYMFNDKEPIYRADEWGENTSNALYKAMYHRIKYREVIPQVALANSSLWGIKRAKL